MNLKFLLSKVEYVLKSVPSILNLFSPTIAGRRLFPRKLFNIMLYTTNRCNSQCQTCSIWKQQPKVDLSAETVNALLKSRCVSRFTAIGVEGGEFIIHPECEKILSNLKDKNYGIMSNAILVDRLVELVKKYQIREVAISFDGREETYKKARGVDNYNNVVTAAKELKKLANVGLCFTFSPWNEPEDYNHVWKVCNEIGVRLLYNIYSDIEFFDKANTDLKSWMIDTNPDGSPIKNSYFLNYKKWLSGDLILPCLSINTNVVVYPNGDVPLCQHRKVILGNIYDRSLDGILNDPKTIALQRKHRNCNGCWISYHRYWDLALVSALDRVLPHAVVKSLVGEYKL